MLEIISIGPYDKPYLLAKEPRYGSQGTARVLRWREILMQEGRAGAGRAKCSRWQQGCKDKRVMRGVKASSIPID